MILNKRANQFNEVIAKSSHLYDYWKSDQKEFADNLRLQKATKILNHNNVSLFRSEPYKWEILYQFAIRQIANGNKDYFRALVILLSDVEMEENIKLLSYLEMKMIFDKFTTDQLLQHINIYNEDKQTLPRKVNNNIKEKILTNG